MNFGKAARKVKRIGKTAYQFRVTSTFEYVELTCSGTWRPSNLRVIWLRSHRRVQSIDVKWVPSEDRGPNGAVGKATFDPRFSVALIITVYGDLNKINNFEEKLYKYYIESDGPSGKKIVGSFTIDISEYATVPGSKHTLDMAFKPVSKKVKKAVLGITLQSEFIKQGNAADDDMQSTFSAVSAGQDSLQFEEEEEEEESVDSPERITHQGLPQASGDSDLVTLGTGEMLKRTTIPDTAPSKPHRQVSPNSSRPGTPQTKRPGTPKANHSRGTTPEPPAVYMNLPGEGEEEVTPLYVNLPGEGEVEVGGSGGGGGSLEVEEEKKDSKREVTPESPAIFVNDVELNYRAEGDKEKGQTTKKIKRESKKDRKEQKKLEKEREKQEENERKQREKLKKKEKKKSRSPSPTPEVPKRSSPPKEEAVANGMAEESSAARVKVVQPFSQISDSGQPVSIVLDTTQAGEGELHATCKGTKVKSVHVEVKKQENGHYCVQFTPEQADVYMLSVQWGENDIPGSTFIINLNHLPTAVQEEQEGEQGGQQRGEGRKLAEEEEVTQNGAEGKEKGQQVNERHGSVSANGRKIVISKEDWTPATDHTYEDMPGEEGEQKEVEPPSPLEAWLGDAQFTDCFGEPASQENLENAEIIGLYFSANWCPPCRRFLPKLVKFYHHLKQSQKPFELLYVSSDYSKQDMTKYMQEQQVPWLALAFDSTMADKLRADYNISAIPILTIVSKEGVKLEEQARKSVEQATSSAAVLKLYSRWLEKSRQPGEVNGSGETEKKGGPGGLLKTIKSAIHTVTTEVRRSGSGTGSDLLKLKPHDSNDPQSEGGRVTVEPRQRSRSKNKQKEGSPNGLITLSVEEMEEKEEKLRHLEEVNISLRQTNADLNEEVAELKRQIGEIQSKLSTLEQSSRQLEDEKRELIANLNIRGWLLKRGAKGPTANVWRRRYFRCDQGSKIYYYKSSSEGSPQGFIDLDKVVSVQEVSAAQQDKNHATFLVQCEGRTFQLQAHDETTMRKWMSAIEYLKDWRQKNSVTVPGAEPI